MSGQNDDVFTLLECHVNLDIEGFEDKDENGEPTGIKLPYIVTIEEGSREVLSIRRNYAELDPKKKKIQYFNRHLDDNTEHIKKLENLDIVQIIRLHTTSSTDTDKIKRWIQYMKSKLKIHA